MASGFGVDVGGSGIKGAPVDLDTGRLLAERVRVETPQPATPEAVISVVGQVLGDSTGRFGLTLPSVVVDGTALTAANIDPSWVGTDVRSFVQAAAGREAVVVNDADAAGVAEVRFGAAQGVRGTVLLLTLGTGIGSALFRDGELVPNTELGHLELDGHEAEHRASDAARKRHDLSWEQWAQRLNAYLTHVDLLVRPDLVVLGGGVSKKADQWLHLLDVRPPVRPAGLKNDAGIVGAALLAAG
ncbi:MAG: Polyphosphate glucokinase [uncultured Actinomycetospora sp.]|uniref:Polyphosphate glucokinase n=1 Tax=uncultured Actinomycetospora sp. TaxID=1135996 RepID=A0A6J4HKR8_9PSEU|nr:MAG: Polyphosphate glucokinase [uncultured Actinomycetospora sp.]